MNNNNNSTANRIAHTAVALLATTAITGGFSMAVAPLSEAPAAPESVMMEEIMMDTVYIMAERSEGAPIAADMPVEELSMDTAYVIAARPAGAEMATGELAVEEVTFADTYLVADKAAGAQIAADMPVEEINIDAPVLVRGYRTAQGAMADARR